MTILNKETRMNIFALPGSKVVFAHPNAGWPDDQRNAAAHLKLGETYEVRRTDVHRSSTDVYLVGLPGHFNSVMFDDEVK